MKINSTTEFQFLMKTVSESHPQIERTLQFFIDLSYNIKYLKNYSIISLCGDKFKAVLKILQKNFNFFLICAMSNCVVAMCKAVSASRIFSNFNKVCRTTCNYSKVLGGNFTRGLHMDQH